jgi:hypothetical protein
MKGKTGANVSTAKSVLPVEDIGFDANNESVNELSSMTEEEWKPKKHRLNANQKQEKLETDLRAKVKYSRAHKAATKLYAAELEKGEKGMSSWKVKAAIKKVQWSWFEPCNNSPLCGYQRRDEHVSPEKGSNRTYSGAHVQVVVCQICNVHADQSVELHRQGESSREDGSNFCQDDDG